MYKSNVFDENMVHYVRRGSIQIGEFAECVEKSLLDLTMEICGYNQSRAAMALGLSRGCFRTKLKQHFGDKYFRVGKNG